MFPQATLCKPAKGSVVSQSSQFSKMAKKKFRKWPLSYYYYFWLMLLHTVRKKIGYDSSKTNSNYTGFLILYFQVFVHCPILHTVNVFLVSPLKMTQRLPKLNLTCMAIPANF